MGKVLMKGGWVQNGKWQINENREKIEIKKVKKGLFLILLCLLNPRKQILFYFVYLYNSLNKSTVIYTND